MAEPGDVDQVILVKFAQKLADNEKRHRDRAVKKLRKWLSVRSQSATGFTESDMLKVWKGLHYCMWMSDKPLIQEELSERIAALVSVFHTTPQSLLYFEVFLTTEAREWFGIDRLRLEKFMLLIRQVVRSSLQLLPQSDWQEDTVRAWTQVYCRLEGRPDGLISHLAFIYLDELCSAGAGQLDNEKVLLLLEPYCDALAHTHSKTMFTYIKHHVFDELLAEMVATLRKEKSDEADSEDESEDTADAAPRLKLPPAVLAKCLFDCASSKTCLQRNRKPLYRLVQVLQDLAIGVLPQQPDTDIKDDLKDRDVNMAADDLMKFEEKLAKSTGKAYKNRVRKEKARKNRRRQREEASENTDDAPSSKRPRVLPPGEDEPNSSGSDKENHARSPEGAAHSPGGAVGSDRANGPKIKNKFKQKEKHRKEKKPKLSRNSLESQKETQGGIENQEFESAELETGGKKKQKKGGKAEVEVSPISKDDAAVFMGGFVSDSDEEIPVKTKKKRKSKVETTLNAEPVEKKVVDSVQEADNNKVNSSKKKKRKSIPKTVEDMPESEEKFVEDLVNNKKPMKFDISAESNLNLFGGDFFSEDGGGKKKKGKRKSEQGKNGEGKLEEAKVQGSDDGSASTKGKKNVEQGQGDAGISTGQFANSIDQSAGSSQKKKTKRKSEQGKNDEQKQEEANVEVSDDGAAPTKGSRKAEQPQGDAGLFTGAFFNGVDQSTGSAQKKKGKRKSVQGKQESGEVEMELNSVIEKKSDIVERKSGSPFLGFTEKDGSTLKMKKSRRKSLGDALLAPALEETENKDVVVVKKSKKKRKSLGDIPDQETIGEVTKKKKSVKKDKDVSEVSPGSKDTAEEVDIWVPNKKYKGAMKDAFANEADAALSMNIGGTPVEKVKGEKKKQNVDARFMQFEKLKNTPPAFVKKALAKVLTPKSAARSGKKVDLTTPEDDSTPGSNRKVIFNMNLNQSQDFRDSLTVSPQLPFNPTNRPDQGILKPSPLVTRSPRVLGSPMVSTPKQKLSFKKKKRNSASDFF